jgi:hypothetical protein
MNEQFSPRTVQPMARKLSSAPPIYKGRSPYQHPQHSMILININLAIANHETSSLRPHVDVCRSILDIAAAPAILHAHTFSSSCRRLAVPGHGYQDCAHDVRQRRSPSKRGTCQN